MDNEKILVRRISELLDNIPYYKWCQIRHGIERAYESQISKISVKTEDMLNSIQLNMPKSQ